MFIILTRKQLMGAVAGLCFLLGLAAGMGPLYIPASISVDNALKGRLIIIDPGHGGRDPGAVGSQGLLEKDIVLDIGLKLRDLIQQAGGRVVMTRIDDRDLADPNTPGSRKQQDLKRRIALANEQQGDVFLSIHANAISEPVWSGAQTFYLQGEETSKRLAVLIQNELVNSLGPNRRKAKSADYWVLRDTNMYAALIEVGFLSNPREERLLAQEEYRLQVAKAIFQGVSKFFLERRISQNPSTQVNSVVGEPDFSPRTQPGPDEIKLFFAGSTNREDGLVGEIRPMAQAGDRGREELAQLVLEELLKGPGYGSILLRTIPRGTNLLDVRISGGVCRADFSQELAANHWGGSRSELLTIYSIVNTLCLLPGISGVQISIEGKKDTTIGGHILLDEIFKPDYSLVVSLAGTIN